MKQVFLVDAVMDRAFYVIVSVLLLVTMANTAYGDTYNFYFDKNKKKQHTVEQSDEAETIETDEGSQSSSNGAAPDSPVAAPAPTAGQPVIIHNNVSVPPLSPPPYMAPQPNVPGVTAAIVPPPAQRPKWKIGLGALVWAEKSSHSASSFRSGTFNTNWDSDPFGSSSSMGEGVVVNLGYRFTPALGINGFVASATNSSKAVAGIEGEWFPVRLDVGTFDVFELGGMLGAANISGRSPMPHLGVRTNINFGPHFSLTAAIRANKDYAMGESGFTVNF